MQNVNMPERTIMIFPQFSNQKIIDEIRKKYDPLYHLVEPHVTLVFPFKSSMSDTVLSQKLEESIKGTAPFSLSLQGISRQKDAYGNYLFLNVKSGSREITGIHDSLYMNMFDEPCRQTFIPHMTIGSLNSPDKMEEAYQSIKNTDTCFETIVKTVSVERIGNHGESIIIMEKNLC